MLSSDTHQQDPPIPVLENTYFLAFCLLANACNYIECVLQRIQDDRSVSPFLLLSAVLAAAVSAALGATALEVLFIFIPMGINVGLTALSFIKDSHKTGSKEMV